MMQAAMVEGEGGGADHARVRPEACGDDLRERPPRAAEQEAAETIPSGS